MSDFIVKNVNDEPTFVLEQVVDQALVNDGHILVDAATKNTFVDKNIHIDLEVPNASDPVLDVNDITGSITMGTATDGVYSPVANLSGKVNVTNAGWMTAGDKNVSENNVKIGKVNQSTLKNGNTAIASGAEIIPDVSEDQTINITEGYEAARTIIVAPMEDGQAASVASGNATVSTLTYTADSANHTFDISATETIPAPSVTTPGFISTTKGTKTAGTATVAATVDEVTVGVTASETTKKVKPVIARTAKPSGDAWVDAASGAATTSKPSAGAYVRVDAAAIAESVTATGKVSQAGYGTTTDYQADTATTINVGSNAADSAYVPITAGAVTANGATVSSVALAYNSTGGNFDVTGSANIPAPTVGTAGYVGNGVGAANGLSNGAQVAATVAKVGIEASVTGGDAVTPVISKDAATNVDSSAATKSKPSAGFYVAVNTAAGSSTVNATAVVTSAGYGTTTSGQYTTTPANKTVTVNAAGTTYVPITAASFANAATNGHTYEDISSTAPILVSDDYLYINKGYTNDVKISLAQLVPDDATITAATGAAYMLSGQSAYDSQGKLVVGSIPTYAGAYTIA